MIRSIGTLAAGALLLAACAREPAGAALTRGWVAGGDIAGSYRLMRVDDRLPSSPVPDSAGGSVSIVGGRLTLGKAAPETYVATPAGLMAGSCVHEIPNGARVDSANVVHLPDGTSYKLSPCGDGPYTLALSRRYVAADGTTRVATDSTVGLYTWSTAPAGDTLGLVTLVGSGLGGSIAFTVSGPVFRIGRLDLGRPLIGPVLVFSLGWD